jgi:Protein of unknown function (DUF1570)
MRPFDGGDEPRLGTPPPARQVNRRAWLAGTLLGLSARITSPVRANLPGQDQPNATDDDEIKAVQAAAQRAGLRGVSSNKTEHFLCAGDAPKEYRAEVLGACEQLATVFLGYFRQHGFTVAFPERRMVVVILKDDRSYAAFLGQEPGDAVGGHYDLDTNRLVVFDFRSKQAELAAAAARVNTFTLAHETAHLLSFNTGLLPRQADVPLCVSEGLATFVEMWRPNQGRRAAALGATNRSRLTALLDAGNDKEPWFEIAEVLKDDKLFDNADTQQLAYAESWLFAHYLLTNSAKLPKFQSYLKALSAQRQDGKRLQCAEAHLGSLSNLDRDVKRHARALLH